MVVFDSSFGPQSREPMLNHIHGDSFIRKVQVVKGGFFNVFRRHGIEGVDILDFVANLLDEVFLKLVCKHETVALQFVNFEKFALFTLKLDNSSASKREGV